MFVSAEATILHADADAFFASVEQRDDPSLRSRPVIVGMGVVMAASYEARAYGIRGAMGGAEARRLCPHAVVVKPRMNAYVEAGKALFEVRSLRREVSEQVGLAITVGVARTKHLAKVASGVAKPDGLLVVPPDREEEFLHPLPVERLWGVGAATAERLHDRGIVTVGELARLSETALVSILGRASGRRLHALANNRDPRRVRGGRRRRSIGSQSALGRRPRSPDELDAVLVAVVDRVTRRLRAAQRVGRTVVLRLRFGDFSRATRSHTLPYATAETRTILATMRALFAAARPTIKRRGITLIGITIANLEGVRSGVQLSLPLDRRWSVELDLTLDELRERFGSGVITRAALLGRDTGPAVPPIPD